VIPRLPEHVSIEVKPIFLLGNQNVDFATLVTEADASPEGRCYAPRSHPMTRRKIDAAAARNALILELAKRRVFLETLATRNSDRLDFRDVAVWAIRKALAEAYEAGRRAELAMISLTSEGGRRPRQRA
jgi:hypothetical protein